LAVKNVVLVCTVIFAAIWSVAAGAQAPGNGCSQIVQQINDDNSGIADNANSYWTHRANFVALIFGPSNAQGQNSNAQGQNSNAQGQNSNAQGQNSNAQQEEDQGNAIKAGMPNRLAGLRGHLTAAQAQNCLSPDQLSALTEPSIKSAKRVNFDQFPPEVPIESPVGPGPPEMPQ
jgi:hypothetical protein